MIQCSKLAVRLTMRGVMSRSVKEQSRGSRRNAPTVDRDSVRGPNMLVMRPKQMVSVCFGQVTQLQKLSGLTCPNIFECWGKTTHVPLLSGDAQWTRQS